MQVDILLSYAYVKCNNSNESWKGKNGNNHDYISEQNNRNQSLNYYRASLV